MTVTKLYRIEGQRFVAGVEVDASGRVYSAAPKARFCLDWRIEGVRDFCAVRDWKIELCHWASGMVEARKK